MFHSHMMDWRTRELVNNILSPRQLHFSHGGLEDKGTSEGHLES